MGSSIAIMQPYFLPYLGYFQLMKSVDQFVIYDDIKFTKKGWINRNRLLFNDRIEYITLPLERGSDYALINERRISNQWQKDRIKYERKINQWYHDRANFKFGLELYNDIADSAYLNAYEFINRSVLIASKAVGVKTKIIQSSSIGDFSRYKGPDKVKEICKELGAEKYINPIGGVSLYDKADFENSNIELKFLQSKLASYQQVRKNFVAGLSILDLIMSIDDSKKMSKQIGNYQII
jgi:hypothetical protein